MLIGPWVPWPHRDGSVRARLFLIVDDHSRLLVDRRFLARERPRLPGLLRRAITRRGLPQVFYADNGAPFSNASLTHTCGVLGIRLVQSKPCRRKGGEAGKAQPLSAGGLFLAEATHRGIESLDELSDLFAAWAGQVANRRVHAETGQAPIERVKGRRPAPPGDSALLREAFRWSVVAQGDPHRHRPAGRKRLRRRPPLSSGRRAELRYDPEDLTRIDVFLDGKPAGAAVPFVTRRHVHRAVPQAAPPQPQATGVDYLGLVAAAHEEAAGTGAKIDFTQLGRLTSEPGQEQGQEEER